MATPYEAPPLHGHEDLFTFFGLNKKRAKYREVPETLEHYVDHLPGLSNLCTTELDPPSQPNLVRACVCCVCLFFVPCGMHQVRVDNVPGTGGAVLPLLFSTLSSLLCATVHQLYFYPTARKLLATATTGISL